MKCDDFQKALLAGELEAGERNRHLESCPECREYARIVEALECPSLPAEFDAAVVAACRRELRRAAFPWRSVLTACCSAAAMIALFFAFHAFSGPEITAESTHLTAAELTEELEFAAGLDYAAEELKAIAMELELIAGGM